MEESVGISEALNFVELTVCSNEGNDSLKRFIEAYESHPELWNRGNAGYSNKIKKTLALEKLLEIYREIKPQAGIKDVTKKLNTLRSNYRRELNKIRHSIRCGSGPDEVYKPSSWVFYALQFLGDEVNLAPLIVELDKTGDSHEEVESACHYLQSGASFSSTPPAKRRKFKSSLIKQANSSAPVQVTYSNSLLNKNHLPQEDEYLNIAKVWAYKLKGLGPMQRVMTQKAINDLFFKAEMENLQKESLTNSSSANAPTVISSSPVKSSLVEIVADNVTDISRNGNSTKKVNEK